MLGGHDTLRTPVVKTAFGAMVVGVTGAKAVHLVLRRHHEAAFTAADDSGIEGVREDLVDRARGKWRTTDPLTRPGGQAPLLCGDLPKPLRRIGSGQHH